MNVTQKDIADRLGVSRELVKCALNGNGRVSPENRERILREAEKLGYTNNSNLHARTLVAKRHGRRQRSGTIAVLMPDAAAMMRDSFYFSPVLGGVEDEIVARGYEMIMATYPEGAPSERGLPRIVREGEVDGVISFGYSNEVLRFLVARGIERVSIAVDTEGTHSIRPDDAAGIRQATQHLMKLGHRKLAYVGLKGTASAVQLRGQAFADTVKAAGFERNCYVVTGVKDLQHNLIAAQLRPALQAMFAEGEFTGLVCYNDTVAMHVVRELEANGLRVPQDVSVTGFDDYTTLMHFHPAITSIAFDREAMGRRAVALLLEAADFANPPVAGYAAGHWQREVLPVKLTVRNSAAPLHAPTLAPTLLEVS